MQHRGLVGNPLTPEPLGPLEAELAQLIIDIAKLEDVTAAEMDSDLPLFFEGLGLDSIDALELGIALEKRYGMHIDEDSGENAPRFASLRTLAAFVESQRVR